MNSKIELKPVESTNIWAIGWKDKVLAVKFKNGDIWEYYGISEDEYLKFKKADSIGKYFHKNIKGKYKEVKIQNKTI